VASAPNYLARDLADLYVLQQLDRKDALGRRSGSLSIIFGVRDARIAAGIAASQGLRRAAERAILIEFHDALTNERPLDARRVSFSYEEYMESEASRIEYLMLDLSLFEVEGRYLDAWNLTADIRAMESFDGEFDVELGIVEDELKNRIRMETGSDPAPALRKSGVVNNRLVIADLGGEDSITDSSTKLISLLK
jgi:hypothetical protein